MERNLEDINIDVTYSKTHTKEEIWHITKIIISFIAITVLWFLTVTLYQAWGEMWLRPAIAIMWIMGAITSYKVAEERDETIKETKYTIIGYCLFLIVYRWTIQKIAPLSSSQVSAALNISVPSASGIAAAGLLQNVLIWSSLMIPIGFLGWCAKKFKVFKGRNSKEQELNKLKGLNQNRRRR